MIESIVNRFLHLSLVVLLTVSTVPQYRLQRDDCCRDFESIRNKTLQSGSSIIHFNFLTNDSVFLFQQLYGVISNFGTMSNNNSIHGLFISCGTIINKQFVLEELNALVLDSNLCKIHQKHHYHSF